MKILKYILILIVLSLIGFAIFVALQPEDYKVTRTRTISAPPVVIHDYIDDYKAWSKWSPWLEQEPEASITYGDPFKGEGASYSWKGDILGEGNMHTNYTSADSLHQELNFITPYESTASVFWNLDQESQGTQVTWGMQGKLGFMEKAFMVFQGDMNSLIGPDYERGLFKLDSVIAADMKKYNITIIGETNYGGGYYMYKTTATKIAESGNAMAEMLPEVAAFMYQNNIPEAGKPFTIYQDWDTENKTTILSACIPVRDRVITPSGSEVLCGFQNSGTYFKSELTGDYSNLNEAWSKTEDALIQAGFEKDNSAKPFEVYLNTPEGNPNPSTWKTEIYIPVKAKTEIPLK